MQNINHLKGNMLKTKTKYKNCIGKSWRCYFICFFIWACFVLSTVSAEVAEVNSNTLNYDLFFQTIEKADDANAISVGKTIFEKIEQKYSNDEDFKAYTSRLNAVELLAKEMVSQLYKARQKQMLTFKEALFDKKKENKIEKSTLVTPAKTFYEKNEIFFRPINIAGLANIEKKFLVKYYDVKMRNHLSQIAQSGQALAIAEPGFKGTYDYVLVLPLLHTKGNKPINIDSLPKWMQQPEVLTQLSDSCLLHYGFPQHAMRLAKTASKLEGRSITDADLYKSLAKRCDKAHSNIAVGCLEKAIGFLPGEDLEQVIALKFDIVQIWMDSENFALAASEAGKIAVAYPNNESFAKAMWLHCYNLLRSNNTEAVLATIDKIINDKRCQAYEPKLMYIKWLALREYHEMDAQKAALEYDILNRYPQYPMVASILLSRAIDYIAREENNYAYEALTQIIEKFPSTKAAEKAKKILERHEANKNTVK